MITNINQLDLTKRYTYADYKTWQFDDLVELIRGKIVHMSPAPNRYHQEISFNLTGLLWAYLRKQKCSAFAAPFDVRLPLPGSNTLNTVVQPDICIICDPSKLDDQGCHGAPDWVIEILSKSTSKKDFTEKFDLYQHAGVKEYWMIHPHEQTILVYVLNSNKTYELIQQKAFVKDDKISVSIFSDLLLDTNEIFPLD